MLEKLRKIIADNKGKVFYKNNNECLTYDDLALRAENLSVALSRQGNGAVIIYGDKSVNMAVSVVACLMAKRAYVPVSIGTPVNRIKSIINACSATLIINNSPCSISDLNTECVSAESVIEKYEKCFTPFSKADNEIAYIIFTSGSTGSPKGVPISYKNLENFIDWLSNFRVLKDFKGINVLNQASFSFDLSVADFYYSLFNGHTLIGMESEVQSNLQSVFNVICDNRINLMVVTPTFIKLLLLSEEFNEKKLPYLSCIYFCGEILEVKTVKRIKERFKNISIINAYGPTEATSAVSGVVVTDGMLELEYLPIGEKQTSAVDIEILNGEIILKGESVFGGYLGVAIDKCYKENGINCFKTNDLGYFEGDFLFCKGRMDNQIKYSGYRIELGDIENNLLKIKGVNQAVVVAKKSSTNTVKLIKAFVVLDDGTEIPYVKDELKKLLPRYMLPKSISVLCEIPINCNGKYDRKALEEL